MTYGYYQVPTPRDPKGYYNYNGSKLESRSLLNVRALAFHELAPGHHFQINLQTENDALPPIRRESTAHRVHRRMGRVRVEPGRRSRSVRGSLRSSTAG